MDLKHAYRSASFARGARAILDSVKNDGEESSSEIAGLVRQIDNILHETPKDKTPLGWRVMDAGLRVLASQIACRQMARGEEGNLQVERTKLDVLTGDLKRLLSSDSCPLPGRIEGTRQTLLREGDCEWGALLSLLLALPLSTIYSRESVPSFPYSESPAEDEVANPMLRLIIFLDGHPIVSPQLLHPNLLYPLEFRVRGVDWPVDACRLHLKLSSTCPMDEYNLSDFVLDKPHLIEDGQYEGKLEGNVRFMSGQSSLVDDLVFAVHGAFETSEGSFVEIPVIGHNELRLRVIGASGHSIISGNCPVDRHLMELLMTLLSDCPGVIDEMPELLEMLQVLARLVASYAQGAIFKELSDVSERDFQTTTVKDLRFQLGQDIQEHPNQAGGITDVRYKGVIVELKVERENGDRAHIAQKYAGQVAQYAGVEARQVSVLLVLDLTPKDNPPGDIRNDIMLTDIETHGGSNFTKNFPSKAFVFVVNGNTKSPSTYSR